MTKNCGTCSHGHIVPGNLKQRVCRGAPPQIVAIPMPGKVELRHMWPTVEAIDEGCSLHKMKLALDTTEGNA